MTIPKINIELLKNNDYSNKYKEKIIDMKNAPDRTPCNDQDEKWIDLVDTCKKAGKEVLGTREKHTKPPINKEIKFLTEEKQRLCNKLKGCNSQKARNKLKYEAKTIKKNINKKLKEVEENDLDKKMEHLELIKDDNTKYFYVLRSLHNSNNNKKAAIIVKDKDGNVPGSTADKIKIIETYFKETLAPEKMEEEFLSVPPCEMTNKFTAKEIKQLAKRLNN